MRSEIGVLAEEPAAVEEYVDAEDPSVTVGWPGPRSLAEADWALERIARLERELAEVDEMEAAAIARIKARSEALRKTPARGVSFFRGHVQRWAEDNRPALLTGKAKSRKLHHGKIGWRKRPGGLRVLDKDALLDWLRADAVRALLIRTKQEPDVVAVKEFFGPMGEVPPGCEWVDDEESLYIEATGEALARSDK